MKLKAKHIPNILGWLRVIACIALMPLMVWAPFTWYMMAIYMFAGFTDMIDGTIARKIPGAQSEFGATLDSVSDMFLVVITITLLPPAMIDGLFGPVVHGAIGVWDWMYWGFLIALGFKILSGLHGRIKFGEMVYLHCYTTKLLGFILFIIPILYYFIFIVGGVTASAVMLGYNCYLCFAIFFIFLITTEEIIINSSLKRPSRNIKSIWGIKAANAKFAAEDAAKAAGNPVAKTETPAPKVEQTVAQKTAAPEPEQEKPAPKPVAPAKPIAPAAKKPAPKK